MRTCLVQAACGKFRPIQIHVEKAHAEYCANYGIDYLCYHGSVQSIRHPTWDRIPLIQMALGLGNELVIWLDTDSFIVDPSVDLRECAGEFEHLGACKHPAPWKDQAWHFNCGVMFHRNTHRTSEYLRRVWTLGPVPHPTWRQQAAMLSVNDEFPSISPIQDKWNSTVGANMVAEPVISSFHGAYDLMLSDNRFNAVLPLGVDFWPKVN